MREYYYLTGLDDSPYNLTKDAALHLGTAGILPVYAVIGSLVRLLELEEGGQREDSHIYLRVHRTTLSRFEKKMMRQKDTGQPESSIDSELFDTAIVDEKYNGIIPVDVPFDGSTEAKSVVVFHTNPNLGDFPYVSIHDLVCWTEDLELLVQQGRIRKSPTKPSQTVTTDSTDRVAPVSTADDETETKRLQRTVAALALGLMKKHGNTYNRNGEPNASQLAKLATEHLRDATSDRTPHGFSETIVRQTIGAALKACPELKG